ncbi:MAG TPA: succinate dehydrogenase cytochrome b subunit [Chloroflexota bacterium]|nr:succinate dehydrogenase cytochrome b subunit [Chloroflexota bacterium]
MGKKYVMAGTGLIWFGFLILHLWGNLHIYSGATYINDYAGFLRTVGEPFFGYSQLLWLTRILLAPALIVHAIAAIQVKRQDGAGRPHGYLMRKNLESTFASRTMIWGGVVIVLFLIYHLLDFTFGVVNPSFEEGNVYHNIIASFSLWPVSLFYILAMVAVGFHLYHGIWSMFQTVGLNNRRSTRAIRYFASFCAIVLAVGNITIPVAVLTGIVK